MKGTAMSLDVLVVGSYSVDLVFTGLPYLPKLGEEVIGRGFDKIPGEAFTPAVVMHRLGLKVGWAADFGCDEFSQFALQRARQEGLDERLFFHHNRSLRRLSVAASFPKDRLFITYYDPDPTIPAAMKALVTASAKVLFVPGLYHGSLLDAGLKLAKLKNMLLVMDGNAGPEDPSGTLNTLGKSEIARAVKSCAVFLPNSTEARRLTGEDDLLQAARILSVYCPLVVIKDGSNGAYACVEKEIIHSPGIQVDPIDTTGAGDCFNAGFLKAWLDKKPLQECLQWGNVCGGLSTLGHGGANQYVAKETIEHRMKIYAPDSH
jgi:hypothetical protein